MIVKVIKVTFCPKDPITFYNRVAKQKEHFFTDTGRSIYVNRGKMLHWKEGVMEYSLLLKSPFTASEPKWLEFYASVSSGLIYDIPNFKSDIAMEVLENLGIQ